MSKDPVAPLLPPKHYAAMERRLTKVIMAIDKCLATQRSWRDVIMTSYDNADVPTAEDQAAEHRRRQKEEDEEEDDDDD